MDSFRQLAKLPRDLWVICAGIFVNRIGMMALPFLSLYLTKDRGLTPPEAGDVFVAYGIAALVMSPLAGRLTDRFGAPRMMIASQTATALALFAMPFLETRLALFLGVIVWSLCAESFRPASMTAIANLAPPDMRPQAFVLARLAINLGISFGALVGGWLSEVRFDAIFVVNGTTCLLTALVLLPLALRKIVATEAAAPLAEAAVEPAAPRRRRIDPRLWWLCASTLCVALVFFQFDSTMPLFLTNELGLQNRMFGVLLAVNTVLIVLLEVPLNAAIARWPVARTLTLSSVLVAVGFGLFAFANGFAVAVLATIVWTFGEMLCFPAQNALVTGLAPPGRIGLAMGWYLFVFNAAFSFGPWLGARVYHRLGPETLWAACFIVGMIGALLVRRATAGFVLPRAA